MRVSTLFTDKFAAFLWYFGTPFSNAKNKVTRQMKHATMAAIDYIVEVFLTATRL